MYGVWLLEGCGLYLVTGGLFINGSSFYHDKKKEKIKDYSYAFSSKRRKGKKKKKLLFPGGHH